MKAKSRKSVAPKGVPFHLGFKGEDHGSRGTGNSTFDKFDMGTPSLHPAKPVKSKKG